MYRLTQRNNLKGGLSSFFKFFSCSVTAELNFLLYHIHLQGGCVSGKKKKRAVSEGVTALHVLDDSVMTFSCTSLLCEHTLSTPTVR